MSCCIELPPLWVTASRLEEAVRRSGHPHGEADVLIRFPRGCKLMIDSAVRILSLANQLDFCTRRVRLDFVEGESGALGYLNRMGFFDHLSSRVEVTPSRPMYSGAALYRGANSGLVEIARINKDDRDQGLPDRLTEALMRSCRDALRSALFNVRAVGDRPLVVPMRSKNLAFISQFAEMDYDMAFTEQYSVAVRRSRSTSSSVSREASSPR